jgi:hypothetical protein
VSGVLESWRNDTVICTIRVQGKTGVRRLDFLQYVFIFTIRGVVPKTNFFMVRELYFPLRRTRENVAGVNCLGKRFLSLMSSHFVYNVVWFYRNLPTSSDIFWHLPTSSDIFWHLPTSSDIFWHLLETHVEILHACYMESRFIFRDNRFEDVRRCQNVSEDGSSSSTHYCPPSMNFISCLLYVTSIIYLFWDKLYQED